MKLQFLASFTGEQDGNAWPVVFIDEGETIGRGWGIWKQGLEASLPNFQSVWVQGFRFEGGELNHLSDDVRAVFPSGVIVGNVVGMADNAQLTTLANGKQGITGFFRPASDKLDNLLLMAQRAGKLGEFGLSINGEVTDPAHLTRRKLASGKEIDEVLKIDTLYSVDMVSHPGRGGGFLNASVLASAGLIDNTPPNSSSANGEDIMLHVLQEYLTKKGIVFQGSSALDILASIDMTRLNKDEQTYFNTLKASVEAGKSEEAAAGLKLLVAALPDPPQDEEEEDAQKTPVQTGKAKEPKPVQASVAEQRLLMTDTTLRVRLALQEEQGLQAQTKKLIASKLDGHILTDEQIAAEIAGYKQMFAAENPDAGKPKPVAASGIRVGLTAADKIQQAADQMFGVRPDKLREAITKLHQHGAYPADKMLDTYGLTASADIPSYYEYPAMSLKQLYIACTGDTDVSFDFNRLNKRGLLAAAIKETIPFGDALGNTLNRRLIQDWMMNELRWREISTIKPGGFSDFRPQEIIIPGGFGELATINEDDVYPEIALPTDSKETYTPGTKGNLLPFTRKAILRDDVGLVNKMLNSMRRAAQHTFNKAFFYKLAGYVSAINDYTMADGNPIYDAVNHYNLVNGAYTYANLKAARQLMRKQKEKESNIPLDLMPKYHILPTTFEDEGLVYILTPSKPGDVVNDVNVIRLAEENVIVVDDSLLGNSGSYAYLLADPMDYEFLEVAFLNNQQVPEVFVQNDPTVGDAFKQDRFTWKFRFEFGIGVADYRGVVRVGA